MNSLIIYDSLYGNTEKIASHGGGVFEDSEAGVSGPLWFKGGIQIESSSGFFYEKRNRVTLCHCGASRNKPFCDSSHIEIGFKDKV